MDFPNLHSFDRIGYDTETTGLSYPTDRLFGFSLATPAGDSFYIDIRRESRAIEWFNDSIKEFRPTVICHNASFDWRFSELSGINIPLELLDCTAVRATLIDEHEATIFPWTKKPGNYSLDYLCWKHLGERKYDDIYKDLSRMFGGLPTRNVQIGRLQLADPEIVTPYAKRDAVLALKLWDFQEGEIQRDGLERICAFERKLMPSLIRAERRGIRVDLDYAEQAKGPLTDAINIKQFELDELCSGSVNTNSSPQIKKMFAPVQRGGDWYVGDVQIGTTKKGNPSLGAEYLSRIPDARAELILNIRSLLKTRDTFLAKHVLEHAVDGRVYPTINQTAGETGGTRTGRLSYTDPAMQQIPSRNKLVAAIVKPCFLPEEGHVWVDTDLASFEVRVFAHLAADYDRNIAFAFANDPTLDFHQYVADLVGIPRNRESSIPAANGKQLNLSMIFNQGNGATAEKMGLPWEWDSFQKGKNTIRYKRAGAEAMAKIGEYHLQVPGVKKLINGAKKIVQAHGFIATSYGRRLRFPNSYRDYKASGLLIQATAADINKQNIILIDEIVDGVGHLILNTHDSYGISLPKEEIGIIDDVKYAIEHEHDTNVPILLDYNGYGDNWWDAICK